MLASNRFQNRPLWKKNNEGIEQEFIAIGANSDGGGADRARRAQLRYLFAAAQGSDRFYRYADRRSHREPGHRAVALPADGRFEEGHQHLYQLGGRLGHGRARSLRYDAVSHL